MHSWYPALLFVFTTAVVACGEDQVSEPASVTTVGPEGGTISGPDGFTIVVPPGALSKLLEPQTTTRPAISHL